MKLKNIEIEHFRSIVKTTRLSLEEKITVVLGPNNEGKSNLLFAIERAMSCLKIIPIRSAALVTMRGGVCYFRNGTEPNWYADFPLNLQKGQPNGQSRLLLEFELTPEEQTEYKELLGSATNSSLPVEVIIDPTHFSVNIKKRRVTALSHQKVVKLSRFIRSRFDFLYIPAIRNSEMSLEVISRLVDRELSSLETNDDYRNALKVIEGEQKKLLDQTATSVQSSLRTLLPSVKSVSIQMDREGGRAGQRFRPPDLIVNDGSATKLESKGDGVKSLVAISLMRAVRKSATKSELLVGIEEPESHLHPEAIHQLATMLAEMAEEHQVIITTHSPLLANRNKVSANIIVQKSSARAARSIYDVRESLGVRVQDNLSSAQYVIVVEGESDIIAMDSLFCEASKKFKEMRGAGKIGWDHLYGAGNIVYKIASLAQMVVKPYLIVDGDDAGEASKKRAEDDGRLPSKQSFILRVNGLKECEIEDCFDETQYWDLFCKELGGKPSLSEFQAINDKWKKRARIVASRAGKGWSDAIESDIKEKLAIWVKEDPIARFKPNALAMMKSIVEAIVDSVEGTE